jgi:hypothetical protein
MDATFRDMFEGLRQTAQGMIDAEEGMKRVLAAVAVLQAKSEQEELRVSVSRLEALVLELGQDLRSLLHEFGVAGEYAEDRLEPRELPEESR